MMRWIVGSSLKARRAVVAGAVLLMAVGAWQLKSAKVDVLPEFSPPTVNVQTDALGLSAEEVEQLITVPLEQDLLDGVAWLDTIRSKSVPGLSSIEMIFKPGTNLYRARQVVQERISQAAGLPNVSRPPQMLQPRASTSRTAMVTLSSKELSPLQVGVLARWTIRPRLLAVPGVSNVAIWGQRERQLQVQVDPKKLRDKNVTLEQVISSTGNALWVSPLTFLEASTPGTGGFIDTPNQRLGIQHNLPVIAPADLAKVTIDDSGESASHLTLGDVATVVEEHQPLIGDAIVSGDGSNDAGFLLVIERLPNASTLEVTRGVEAALDELRPGLAGLEMNSSIFRPATYIDNSVDNLRWSVIIGGFLLVAVLLAAFFHWRTALTAVVAVVTSLVVAALVLHLLGNTINALVFVGLVMAIGAVVGDAIVGVDTVVHRLHEDGDSGGGTPRRDVVLRASLESGRTAVWATVAFVVALVPIFLMDGLSGDSFFRPLAVASVVALVTSLLVAITITPALSLLLLSGERLRRDPPLARWLRRGYDHIVAPVVRTPVPAFAAIAVALAGVIFVVPRLDKSLLPPMKDTNLLVHWNAPFGTSLPEMHRITKRARAELEKVQGVRYVGAQVGQAILGDRPVGSDSAEMWVSVDPSAGYDKTVAAVKRVVAGYPGIRHDVSTYSQDRMAAVLGRTSDEVTVRVFGGDLTVLHEKALEVKALMTAIDGVSGARVATPSAEPTLEVEVDLAKAAVVGIKPGDVRRAAATLLSGLRVGSLFEAQKVFDVQVWSTPETRHSLTSVQDLLIDTPSGAPVRLGDVADVRVRATSPSIEHQDISRFVDVSANVSSGNVGAVADKVKASLGAVAFPLEYHAEMLSDYSHQQSAQRRLMGFAIAAAIGIFLVFQAAFGSWRLAIIAFATLPVALAGGLVARWVDGGPMTLATAAGLLAVLAIAIHNSIVVIDRFGQLRASGMSPHEVVARGGRDRVGPIVLGFLAMAGALVPAIAVGNVAGHELLHPLGVVVLGGLVTSAVASLLVLPALYLRFGPKSEAAPLGLDVETLEDEPELAVVGFGE